FFFSSRRRHTRSKRDWSSDVCSSDLGMFLAMGAGALSFLSPCVLPIFPAYLSYITGISVKELQGNQDVKIRSKLLSHSLFFLLRSEERRVGKECIYG